MFEKFSKWLRSESGIKTMRWIDRGVAVIVPATIGLIIYENGRFQGRIEANEEELEFLNGVLDEMKNLPVDPN